MILDRTICPKILPIETLKLRKPHVFQISALCNLYWMDKTQSDTVEVTLHFDAGTATCKGAEAVFASKLFLAGTSKLSQEAIQEAIDQLGGYVNASVKEEDFSIAIYGLKHNILHLCTLVQNAFSEAVFSEEEIADLKREEIQNYKTNLEKVSYLGSMKFRSKLMQNELPYVKEISEDFYNNVERKSLLKFYQNRVLSGMKSIELVGDLDTDTVDALIDLFGKHATLEQTRQASKFNHEPGIYFVEKKGALQTAIRIGVPTINFYNEDSVEFDILNTIFGGYFGSRLMTNIREDKGYTYGINSAIQNYGYASIFQIGTEVRDEVVKATLDEIKKEINLLRNNPVDLEELTLVKNYILGETMASVDGAGAMLATYCGLIKRGKTLDYINECLDRVRNVTPEKIQELAQKHLIWEDFVIVCAGASRV